MDLLKMIKKATGIQAYEDRKEANMTVETAGGSYDNARLRTEELRSQLNEAINAFGHQRLESVERSVKPFMFHLKDLQQSSRLSESELVESVSIKKEQLKELESLEMSTSQLMKGTVAASAMGAVALTGVPAAVTTAVTALATASTGTAISTLSGAAASNAALAWLGGGSIASGGGGVAAGAALLSSAAWAATGGVAVLTAGLIASAHYSKKLTEAKEYEKEVEIAIAQMEKAWVVMDGIGKRINELAGVTEEVTARAHRELRYLAPLTPDFDRNDAYQLEVFKKCGLLAKSVGDLAKMPLLNDAGDISEDSAIIVNKVRAVLAT